MRFVILDHIPPSTANDAVRTDQRHFDLMLEQNDQDRLRTFAVQGLPEANSSMGFLPLADHRKEYLTYEGEISGQRGQVTRHAKGTWSGDLSNELLLSFDSDSPHFSGQSWKIRMDHQASVLFRIS